MSNTQTTECCCGPTHDCPSSCEKCRSYTLVTSGIGSGGGCAGLNGTWAMEIEAVAGCGTCEWRYLGVDITWRIVCVSKVWYIKSDSDVMIFSKANDGTCPPTGTYGLVTNGCSGSGASATLSAANQHCPCDCSIECPGQFIFTIAGFAGACAGFNGTWTLTRTASNSCSWTLNDGTYILTLGCTGNGVWTGDINGAGNGASWTSTADRNRCPPTGAYGNCAATCSCAGVTMSVAAA